MKLRSGKKEKSTVSGGKRGASVGKEAYIKKKDGADFFVIQGRCVCPVKSSSS